MMTPTAHGSKRHAAARLSMILFVSVAVVTMAAGCMSHQAYDPSALPWRTADGSLHWPPPPAKKRIEFAGSITRAADLGIQETRLQRVGRFLFGSSDEADKSFSKPFSIAIGQAGDIYVTDVERQSVFHFDRTRGKLQRWHRTGKIEFISPVSVAVSDNLIFVADTGLGKIIAMNHKGKFLFEIDDEVTRPASLAVMGKTLLAADAGKHRIAAFTLQGDLLWTMGKRGNGPNEFNYPAHIAVDTQSRIYVTDSMNFRIQIFDHNRNYLKTIGSIGDGSGQLSRPKGVAADHEGHVYVVDALFDNIQVFDQQGRFLLHWGAAGSGAGQFWLPTCIAIDSTGYIYVADPYNHRIQVFRYLGET